MRDELIAHDRTISEIAEKLEIDNLVYQSIENLKKSITSDSPIKIRDELLYWFLYNRNSRSRIFKLG